MSMCDKCISIQSLIGFIIELFVKYSVWLCNTELVITCAVSSPAYMDIGMDNKPQLRIQQSLWLKYGHTTTVRHT